MTAAFDSASTTYDLDFSATRLGRLLRQRVWDGLATTFQPGQRVLELGCGTGEDAVWLARRGVSVLATDASAAMLAVAQAKVRQAGLTDRVRFAQMDAARLALTRSGEWGVREDLPLDPRSWLPAPNGLTAAPSHGVVGVYDAALADFGVINCVPDRGGLARGLADQLKAGAALVAVVMGPLCVWEIAWHAAHGDLARAVRRWRSGAPVRVGHASLPVWYPSPSRLRADLAPVFDLRRLVGLGTLLPPSYLSHLVDRWPRLFTRLAALDGRVPFAPWLADHYLAVFERK